MMQSEDSYGRKWPVRSVEIDIGRFLVRLECVQKFDDVLDSFAESHPDDTAMIPFEVNCSPHLICFKRMASYASLLLWTMSLLLKGNALRQAQGRFAKGKRG